MRFAGRAKIPLVHTGYLSHQHETLSRAWLLLPVDHRAHRGGRPSGVPNFQKEAGIARPSREEWPAVAAAVRRSIARTAPARQLPRRFNEALLVATVARRNAPLLNPADTRLDNLLVRIMDCLFALREAWQTEIDHTWKADTHGLAMYWNVLHPAVRLSPGITVTTAELRGLCRARAAEILKEAVDLVG